MTAIGSHGLVWGMTDPNRLHRTRTGARAAVTLGIAASLGANMLAAHPSVPGWLIAAWPPLALLVTVELLTRIPSGRRGWRTALESVAAASIAAVAAWVSYWHMVEVALAYGEAGTAAHLLPFSVDGLVVVASLKLAEINRQINQTSAKLVRPAKPAANPMAGAVDTTPTRPAVRNPQVNVSVEKPTLNNDERRQLILTFATEHPEWVDTPAGRTRIAEAVGCSERTVRRTIADNPPTPVLSSVPTLEKKAAHA